MNKWIMYSFIGLMGTSIYALEDSQEEAIEVVSEEEAIEETDEKPTFFQSHPYYTRAAVVALTAIESLAINSQTTFLGLTKPNIPLERPWEYTTLNLKISFPSLAKLFRITSEDSDLYDADRPETLTDATAAATAGLIVQNFIVAHHLQDTPEKPASLFLPLCESIILTTAGYITGWALLLGYGAYLCRKSYGSL